MTGPELHVVVPGSLDQRTGGYVYDALMVSGLRALGWTVTVHELAGAFPEPDTVARSAMNSTLESIPDGAWVLIDGLAMGGLPSPIEAHGERLRILALVHHPLAAETGLSETERESFEERERRALQPCRGVVVSSEFSAHGLEEYGVPPARIRAVLPGTARAPHADGPGPGEPPVLLCVASVTPRKGHDVLVAALARIRDLPWRCVCAGALDRDRAHADYVRRGVAEAGLEERIDFLGERGADDLAELYHGASVFVLASHYEGYGMALAEALAHGLPIVSTTGGAIPFTVPADAGVLVAPGDETAFADALRKLLTPGTTTREELAAGARRRAEELPTWQEAVASFAAAVEELTQ
ncbi:MAG: glycosyltransferase family 4 protein [Gemmatimonadota bacterium]|nr:glycosyltransferase family 4 protein [Gemmatimonadota bacterium]